jgi:imidazolonepropionase-like amidohydrolase
MQKFIFKNATLYTITSGIVYNSHVWVEKGKIKKISSATVEGVQDAAVIDCRGRPLLPGFIDVHTHLGLYDEGTGWAGNDANETIEPMTPHIRAFDGVHPFDPGFQDALKYGVTTVNVMPGSANVIGGTTAVIKTFGKNIAQMLVRETSGLKLALGENPKRIHSNGNKESITRMGIMGMLREAFHNARYCIQPEELRVAPLVLALKREIPVRVHAHRADDILSAVRLAQEFDLDLRIEHCTEGHLIAKELRDLSLKVCVGPTFTRRSKIELKNKSWLTYQELSNNGVEVSITTDHPYTPVQYLNMCAAVTVREGWDPEKALEAITINPARNLGVDQRLGSIEEGKDADLVLWSHHPFHFMAKPLLTMIDGEIAFKNL